ncbi:MAG: RagB/SusD family nutrient uptake outer membrane protein, partial [Muribaculaceae bacterium]|nr:RagB/SusD family nutrient uptake outer membrane protein [Muribaculaceae bacterium]
LYTVTRWTALALKSRVTLFEGTFRKYHGLEGWEELLGICAEVSNEFIRNSGYTIYNTGATPYLSLFSSISAIDSEIVLARAYNSSIGLTHDLNGYLTSTAQGRPGILKDIINMYLMTDGTPFTSRSNYETMTLAQESQNRDKRLAQTIRTPGYKRIGETAETSPNLSACETGYQPVKYLQAAKYDSYNTSVTDMPIFRAAEVYLNYAEAKAELGTLTQSDLDISIKPLRERAGVSNLVMANANAAPDPYLADNITGYRNVSGANAGVILEIRRERTVELIMEGFRYWDIMRWHEGQRFTRTFYGMYFPGPGNYDLNADGTVDVCLWSGSQPATSAPIVYEIDKDIFLSEGTYGNILLHTDFQRTFRQDRDYLYPIPTDDRILTGGNITQNPGWEDGLNF